MNDEWIPLTERDPGGDENRIVLIWHVFLECYTDTAINHSTNRFYTHWRELPTTGWIRADERAPTADDADGMNCVLAANDDLTIVKVTGWLTMQTNRAYTQWMPTPEGPPKYKELRKLY